MFTGTAVATTERRSVIREMANRYGMEPDTFEATVRATCMPQGRDVQPMTREEFAAGIMVAEKYTLNPILREIYFYPRKGGGIVPVVSIDGWLSLINRRKELDGIEFDEVHDEKGKLVSITCRIYRTDRKHATIVTEHLSECWRDTIPWKMPHRMLRHKALIQCARYAFGFAGIHDEDEAERIVEGTAAAVQQQIAPPAPPPPPAPAEPSRPALQPEPPANANAGPAAPPVEDVEEAEVVEEREPNPAPIPVEPTQEETFDAEAWLDDVRDRFGEARTEADVDGVHEVFGDTVEHLGMTERQKYQDMHEAAMLRVEVKDQPEQAEVTGEPGPPPADDEDDFPGNDAIAETAPQKTPGQVYMDRIRAAITDPVRTLESLGNLWKATKPERQQLVNDGHMTAEQVKVLHGEVMARWPKPAAAEEKPAASPGPSAPPAEQDPALAYDQTFRQRVEACGTVEEINALVPATLSERNKFSGHALHKEWSQLVTQKRKQLSGIA
jgi:phage recombination protein Bet